MKLTRQQIKEKLGEDIKEDYAWVEILTDKQYKSNRQNSLFHSLLNIFWCSGCSSFINYDEMRRYYKRLTGLIEVNYSNDLKEATKNMLWKSIKILPIEDKERIKLIDILKGRREKELSWSEATKEQARIALNSLINDMNESGVIGSKEGNKYSSILKSLGEWE